MSRAKRKGYLLVETILAGLLIGLAMAMTLRLLTWTGAERRSAERRGWAIQEASNAMETLSSVPFDRLSTESAKEVTLSKGAIDSLPEGRVEAEVRTEPDGMKRIDVAVTWKGASGVNEAPVRLTHWVARKEAAR